MPAFAFKAADSAGRVHDGELTAASRSSALETLAARGLIPVELLEGSEGLRRARFAPSSIARWRSLASGRITRRELLSLTQSLAALLNAGLTIDRALQIASSLAPGTASRDIAGALLNSVRSGKSLSESFLRSGQALPGYFVSMISAGEAGGSLPEAFRRLEDLLRKQLQIRERIRDALIYPALLAAVVLATLVVLLAFVLPRFELLFAESQASLPVATRIVLALGRLVADYWMIGIAVIVAMAGLIGLRLRSAHGRLLFDRWALRTRLTFGIPAMTNTGRLLRTVGALCSNGQTLPAALRIARGTVANRYLSAAVDAVLRDVLAGGSLSDSLARTKAFPSIAVQLARVGEETGKLEQMLLSAAAVLEESSQVSLERLLTLLVPLLTIAMGLIVAALIGSVLIGLLSINDLVF